MTGDQLLAVRVQRRRTRGFRLPPNTVCVDRSTKWGNPFVFNSPKHGLARVPAIDGSAWEYEGRVSAPGYEHAFHHGGGRVTKHTVRLLTRAECVELYRRALLTGKPLRLWDGAYKRWEVVDGEKKVVQWGRQITPEIVRAELAGKNLACFCALNQLCHADVLLAVANMADVEAVPAAQRPTGPAEQEKRDDY